MTSRSRLVSLLALVLLALSMPHSAAAAPREATYEGVTYRTGDVVLQEIGGRLGKLIQGVTESRFDHCGLVEVDARGRILVIEAVGPVQVIPLRQWKARGKGKKVVVYRPRGSLADKVGAVVEAARKYKGLPYDIQYELDDAKIYCSELVYKAFRDGAGVELVKTEKLGEMRYLPFVVQILSITGGELPLEREIVSPVALTRSTYLRLVHSDFEAE